MLLQSGVKYLLSLSYIVVPARKSPSSMRAHHERFIPWRALHLSGVSSRRFPFSDGQELPSVQVYGKFTSTGTIVITISGLAQLGDFAVEYNFYLYGYKWVIFNH